MIHLLALAGVLSISFSAVFIRLALVSPVTATFYRGAYAVPVLALVWLAGRRHDHRGRRERLLACAGGLFLAADLDVWHESIALVGAGLATVLANVQIIFVAALGWLLYGERPTPKAMGMIAVMLVGVFLTSGLSRGDAYGANPLAGVAFGVAAGGCYSGFLLLFRASNRSLAPTAGPLLDATLGMVAGALASAIFDPHFSFVTPWPATGWLILLALVSQVFGWLLIARALPRLPAVETSVLLLAQPVFAIVWGIVFFGERLSLVQWIGSGIVLAGVPILSAMRVVVRVEERPIASA